MIATVISGGNRGALQAGIQPHMLVGSPAGALNAVSLATNPTLDTLRGTA